MFIWKEETGDIIHHAKGFFQLLQFSDHFNTICYTLPEKREFGHGSSGIDFVSIREWK